MTITKLDKNGLYWPVGDECCLPAINAMGDIDAVLAYVPKRRRVLQAGGNCGVWANALTKYFAEVWTVEADFTNYLCLLHNMVPNVKPIWAALGDHAGTCGLHRYVNNVGAHHVEGEGSVPMITIDALELDICDLIILDIEGMEPLALKGAAETLGKCKPVLMVEDRHLSKRYGIEYRWTEVWPGYKVVKHASRDTILVPA